MPSGHCTVATILYNEIRWFQYPVVYLAAISKISVVVQKK
jgi:hypothetical protein